MPLIAERGLYRQVYLQIVPGIAAAAAAFDGLLQHLQMLWIEALTVC